jgi:hypothetical protein
MGSAKPMGGEQALGQRWNARASEGIQRELLQGLLVKDVGI